jgi:hypothetical protein
VAFISALDAHVVAPIKRQQQEQHTMDDPAAQLAYYRQQLALLQRVKNPGPDVAALRLNIREAIALLEDTLSAQAPPAASAAPAPAPTAPVPGSNEIFEALKEDKEQEDAVSSDDDMFRCPFNIAT